MPENETTNSICIYQTMPIQRWYLLKMGRMGIFPEANEHYLCIQ